MLSTGVANSPEKWFSATRRKRCAAWGFWHEYRVIWELALKSLNAALEIAENVQIRARSMNVIPLWQMYTNKWAIMRRLIEHYEQFHLIKEFVFNAQSDLRIKNLQVIQQVERAKRENELLQQKSRN